MVRFVVGRLKKTPDFRGFLKIFAELDILRKIVACFLSGHAGKNRMWRCQGQDLQKIMLQKSGHDSLVSAAM